MLSRTVVLAVPIRIKKPVTCCHKGLVEIFNTLPCLERCSVAQQFEDRFHRKFYTCSMDYRRRFKCTYCCQMCRRQGKKTRLFWKCSRIKRVVKAFADCGTSKIRITGGEPSLRKDFPEIIQTVNTPGIKKVATTTNGYHGETSGAVAWCWFNSLT